MRKTIVQHEAERSSWSFLLPTLCSSTNLCVVRLAEAAASWDAASSFDVFLVGAEDMLGLVAPAVLVALFVRMFRRANFAGDVDRFAAQVDAGELGDWTLLVVVLLESHS